MIVGVTGGIGSGKSTVCRMFKALGVPVYEADARARAILDEDAGLRDAIRMTFGEEVIRDDGTIDRPVLAAKVFGEANRARLAELNALVHPAVFADTVRWIEAHSDHAYVIKEAAILFESGAYQGVHVKVTVTAPEAVRLARVMERDGTGRALVLARMASQWPEEKKVALSDDVIVNDGLRPLLPQVLALHEKLMRRAIVN